jgi:hypothetical protein
VQLLLVEDIELGDEQPDNVDPPEDKDGTSLSESSSPELSSSEVSSISESDE